MEAATAAAPARAPAPRRAPSRKRRAPARRGTQRPRATRAAPRPNPALAGAALIPHAAVRTAGAISDISDSGLIMRLTRGRGWIAVLCVLLGGIVTLNVLSLSLNATSGRVGQQLEQLERENSALRGELAERLSAGSVEAAAANLGLAVPPPEDVTYLSASDGDADKLAKLLGVESTFPSDAPVESSEPAAPVYAPPSETTSAPPASDPAPAAPPPSASPPSSGGATGGTTGGVGL